MAQNLSEVDWSTLPQPEDDGGADHLAGCALPDLDLPASTGGTANPSALKGRGVIYVYPMTGDPNTALPDGWDAIPGARGCTPQSCAFRDHAAELREAGAAHLFGLSTQSRAEQAEAAARLHLPFALLSDARLAFADALDLPRFEAGGAVRLKRMTLVVDDGRIAHVFYPVFPPDRSAAETLAWLLAHPA